MQTMVGGGGGKARVYAAYSRSFSDASARVQYAYTYIRGLDRGGQALFAFYVRYLYLCF